MSNLSIQVSLWGANARTEGYNEGQVLALRGARVSDYNGKSLNSGDEHSQMFIDPDNLRTRELQKWYLISKDKGISFNSVTGGVGPTSLGGLNTANGAHGIVGVNGERPDNFKLADELIQELHYHQQKNGSTFNGGTFSDSSAKAQTRFYKISGFVKMIFNDEKILYLSCPDCRKKVIEEDGHWRCETCDKLHSTNLPTYMLSR